MLLFSVKHIPKLRSLLFDMLAPKMLSVLDYRDERNLHFSWKLHLVAFTLFAFTFVFTFVVIEGLTGIAVQPVLGSTVEVAEIVHSSSCLRFLHRGV